MQNIEKELLVGSSIGLIKDEQTGNFYLQVIVDNEEKDLGNKSRNDYFILIPSKWAQKISNESGIEIQNCDRFWRTSSIVNYTK